MPTHFKLPLLVILLLLGFSSMSYGQNKNLLAKVAYENAETAFTVGNLTEALRELEKVDELLGVIMPKSQYLRVQVWHSVLKKALNEKNVESVIYESKRYLALDGKYPLPDEKKEEVTRILVYAQKQNAIVVAHRDEEAAELDRKKKQKESFDSFTLAGDWPVGITVEELQKLKPETKNWKLKADRRLKQQFFQPEELVFSNLDKKQFEGAYSQYENLPVHAAIVKANKIIGYQKILFFDKPHNYGYIYTGKADEAHQYVTNLNQQFGFQLVPESDEWYGLLGLSEFQRRGLWSNDTKSIRHITFGLDIQKSRSFFMYILQVVDKK